MNMHPCSNLAFALLKHMEIISLPQIWWKIRASVDMHLKNVMHVKLEEGKDIVH